jgi:hypothetical protein
MTANSKMPDSASAYADEASSVFKKKKDVKFHLNLLAYSAFLIGICFFVSATILHSYKILSGV